jgi:SAM-dependent methyltransferase
VRALRALWRAHPEAWERVRGILGLVDHEAAGDGPEARIAALARQFDRAAEVSPEGSVALYSLGDPDLLRDATDEAVALLDGWGVLGPRARVIDLGCGIGRFARALGPRVAAVTGLDVAPGMVRAARAACADLPNVTIRLSDGRDLGPCPDASADLVLAADSFPYLVQAGADVAARHVAEAGRVLVPGGSLVILNYAYGRPDGGRADLAGLARAHGFAVLRDEAACLRSWDARAFHLRKQPGA